MNNSLALTTVEVNATREILSTMFVGMSPLSRKAYEESIRQFLQFALTRSSIHPYQSPHTAFLAYKDELIKQYKAATVNKKLSAIRQFFKFCLAEKLIDEGQYYTICTVRNEKEQKPFRTWLDEKSANDMLNAPDTSTVKGTRDRLVIFLMLVLGLRRAEVTKLQWKQLQRVDGYWLLVDVWGKGNSLGTIKIPEIYMSIFDDYGYSDNPEDYMVVSVNKAGVKGKRISVDAINDIIATYAEQLDVKASPHTLRRTCGTVAMKNTKDIRMVQRLLRHSSQQNTEKYLAEVLNLENSATDYTNYVLE
jgi:site-specific recombinase XerD